MKITKQKLKRIIKEERDKLYREYGSLREAGAFKRRTLKDMEQAISYFRDKGNESDAVDLEKVRDMAVEQLASGAEYPSEELWNFAYYELDTVVREEIPHEMIEWALSYDDSDEY
jgi:hypothetical protein